VRWLRSCDVDEEAVDLSLAMGLTKVSVRVCRECSVPVGVLLSECALQGG
jgi:hypothetical protein